MIYARDGKGVLWKHVRDFEFVKCEENSIPLFGVIIRAPFYDGEKASIKEFAETFGIRNWIPMRVASQQTVYELTNDELKTLFAEKLRVPESKIEIKYLTRTQGDDRFGTEYTETYGISVIVSGTTSNEETERAKKELLSIAETLTSMQKNTSNEGTE